ncbi:MAG: hypothetical protein WD118_02210 [Phycisphaeraceae bacterium]
MPAEPGNSAEEQPKPRFLTDVIVEMGFVSQERVREAVESARLTNKTAEQALLENGDLDDEQLSRALAERYGLEFIDLSSYPIDWAAAKLVTRAIAKRCAAIPIAYGGEDALVVAIADPAGGAAAADISSLTRLDVKPVVAARHDIDALIAQLPEHETQRSQRERRGSAHAESHPDQQQPGPPQRETPPAPPPQREEPPRVAPQGDDLLKRVLALADPDQEVDLSPELKLVHDESASAAGPATDAERREELRSALARLLEVEQEFRSTLEQVADKIRGAGALLADTGRVTELEHQLQASEAARGQAERERDELRQRLVAIRDALGRGQ